VRHIADSEFVGGTRRRLKLEKVAMSYENLKLDCDGAALVITIHRPDKRNALSLGTIDEISAAVREADGDSNIRGIVLTGGEQFFSSGADLNEALQVKSVVDGDAFFGRANRLCALLESLNKPVIAAVEGFCITGGLELAMACDIRVGARGSTYAITSARIGTVAGFGGTQRLPRLVGPSHALDMLFSAEPVDADHAFRTGLITRLVDKGQALAEAKRLVAVYEKRGPISLAFAKRAVHRGMQMDIASAVEYEFSLVTGIYGTDDKREGVAAFLEKREAKFAGR
jgi:enoyl-CoA hydratase/carnithine racemase